MKYARYLVFVPVLLLALSLSAMGEEAKQGTDLQQTAGKEKRLVAAMGADGVQRAEVTGGEYYFYPKYIVVKVNKPVELTVKKTPGFVPHDIVVNSPGAGIDFKVDLDSKKPALVKFTPTKTGKYPMYCDKKVLWFKSHRDRGMEGTIEVVE